MSATLTREAPGASSSSTTEPAVTLTIARSTLRTALGKLATAVDTTSKALPVAQHLRVDVAPGRLTMTATDFSTFVRLSVPCDASGTVTALLPAKRLSEIVAALPPVSTVTIALAGTLAVVTAGRSRFELPGMDPAEFPLLPVMETTARSVVQAAPFLDAIDRAVVHASAQDSRPAINVVRIAPEDDRLVVSGVEGAHMAILPGGTITGDPIAACSVHRTAVPVLARVFAGLPDDATLSLAADASRLVAETEHTMASVRLVDLEFPRLAPIIASVTPTRVVECDRLLLSAAIKRVALAAGDTRRVEFTVTPAEVALRAAEDTARAADVVTVDAHTGDRDPVTLALNATFALAVLDTLTTPAVSLSIDAPGKPVLFRPAPLPAGDPTVLLIAPLNIR